MELMLAIIVISSLGLGVTLSVGLRHEQNMKKWSRPASNDPGGEAAILNSSDG